jgi:hypothetical protein
MACSTSFPSLVIDAQLKLCDLEAKPSYWEPSGTSSCPVVHANRCLPGVADWLGRAELGSVYRLVPWDPFKHPKVNRFDRRSGVLAPVWGGTHIPIVRVDPDRPESVGLAVSLTSPFLDCPSGPDSIHGGPRDMWHESIVPIGHGVCSGVITGPQGPTPLPRGTRVTWVCPPLGMTKEPMAADMSILLELEGCFEDLRDAALACPENLRSKGDVMAFEGCLGKTLFPFVAMGIDNRLDLSNSPWPATALARAADLARTAQGIVALDEEKAERFAIAQMASLRDLLPSKALSRLVHDQFVANKLCGGSATPCLPGTPEGDSVQCSTLPDPRDLRNILLPGTQGFFDPPTGDDEPRGSKRLPAALRDHLETMFGHMHSFLATLSTVRRCYVCDEPIAWRFGQSTMHFARRFGLLVDPREAWESGGHGPGMTPDDVLPLATDTMGRPVAFAKRIGKGFAVVVPAEESFTGDRLERLIRFAAEHWSLDSPVVLSNAERLDAQASQTKPDDLPTPDEPERRDDEARAAVGAAADPNDAIQDSRGEGSATASRAGQPDHAKPAVEGTRHEDIACIPSGVLEPTRDHEVRGGEADTVAADEFSLNINCKRCKVSLRHGQDETLLRTVDLSETGLCGTTREHKPTQSARLLACLSDNTSAGVSLELWNESRYHPDIINGLPRGDAKQGDLKTAVSGLRKALKKSILPPGGEQACEGDLIPFDKKTRSYRPAFDLVLANDFLTWARRTAASLDS